MDSNLLDLLAQELGEITRCETECPGIYYLMVQPVEDIATPEYYVIFEDSLASQELRAMGRRLECVPAWVYPLDMGDGLDHVIEYEVLRYKTMHGLPIPDGTSLRTLYGMELCPEYFGTYPVPFRTPWGCTLRHRPLDAGVYWIETDRCVQVLAVCNPVWEVELSEWLWELGKAEGPEDKLGYHLLFSDTPYHTFGQIAMGLVVNYQFVIIWGFAHKQFR